MIDKYEKIVGDLELLDVDKDRDNLIYSYLISDTFEEHDFDLSVNINLTTFLDNICIDEDYNFMHIEDYIEDIKYQYIMTMINRKGFWQAPITKDELKESFIRLGVDENDIDEFIEEIIEELTYDAIEKLNYLIVEDLDYYLRKDEIC